MRGSMRLLVTMTIAVAFTAAIAPRAWFHNCDQAHVDHHHPDQAAITGDLDCEVCSVLVTTFDDRAWKPSAMAVAELDFHFLVPAVAPIDRVVASPASRGPPTC